MGRSNLTHSPTLARQHVVVRTLVYAATGIFIAALALTAVSALGFLLWGMVAGPLWLQWSIIAPTILALLTIAGREFYRKEV